MCPHSSRLRHSTPDSTDQNDSLIFVRTGSRSSQQPAALHVPRAVQGLKAHHAGSLGTCPHHNEVAHSFLCSTLKTNSRLRRSAVKPGQAPGNAHACRFKHCSKENILSFTLMSNLESARALHGTVQLGRLVFTKFTDHPMHQQK